MNTHLTKAAFATAVAALALPLAACGSSDDNSTATATNAGSSTPSATSGGTSTDQPSAQATQATQAGRQLTVFAAASLTQSFTAIGKAFEAAHPGVSVKFSFGGSSDLVAQIQNGAPADVFASADEPNMDKLASDVTGRKDFASNTLEIAVPPDNPADVANLGGLTRPGVKSVVCAVPVPCGAAEKEMEQKAGLTLQPVSKEQSVTDVLGKVESGEADAGIVYVTDVKGAGDKVKGIPIPPDSNVTNTYPIAAVKDSKAVDLAEQFVDFVATGPGQRTLADAGFAKP